MLIYVIGEAIIQPKPLEEPAKLTPSFARVAFDSHF